MIRKIYSLIILLLCVHALVYAGGPGTKRLDFLKIEPGARAASMAGTLPGFDGTVYSINHNPAQLVMLPEMEASFSYINWLEGIKYGWAGFAMPLKRKKQGRVPGALTTVKVEDFNTGRTPNSLGGKMGLWSDSESGGNSIIEGGYLSDAGGYSYRLKADIGPSSSYGSGIAGLWIALNGVNISKQSNIALKLKCNAPVHGLMIGLKDSSGAEKKLDAAEYIGNGSGNWSSIDIPLSRFDGVDLNNMDNISFSFTESLEVIIDDIRFTGRRRPKEALAVSAGYLGTGTMTEYAETASIPYFSEEGTFSASEIMLSLSYARELDIHGVTVPAGVNLRLVRESLTQDEQATYGGTIDIGTLHSFPVNWGRVMIGITFQNIGYISSYGDDTDVLPPFNIRTAINAVSDVIPVALSICVDAPVDNKFKFAFGCEGNLKKTIFIRSGYEFDADIGGLNLGAGFGIGSAVLDYAYAPFGVMQDTHRVSVGYRFR